VYDLLVKAAIGPVDGPWWNVTGPGAFSDPDFIVAGCATDGACEPGTANPLPPLTQLQQRTQFSMWCILAAPLIIGSDIRAMDAYTLATLGNADAILINQDPIAAIPRLLNGSSTQGNPSGAVWARDMENGDTAVALLNLGHTPLVLGLDLSQIGWPAGAKGRVLDVWTKEVRSVASAAYSDSVPPFSATLLRFMPPAPKTQ
jgi:alpha-galactosidase